MVARSCSRASTTASDAESCGGGAGVSRAKRREAWDIGSPKLAGRKKAELCLAGHELRDFETDKDGYSCTYCHEKFLSGSRMLSCRGCDYDVCTKCARARRSATLKNATLSPTLKPSEKRPHSEAIMSSPWSKPAQKRAPSKASELEAQLALKALDLAAAIIPGADGSRADATKARELALALARDFEAAEHSTRSTSRSKRTSRSERITKLEAHLRAKVEAPHKDLAKARTNSPVSVRSAGTGAKAKATRSKTRSPRRERSRTAGPRRRRKTKRAPRSWQYCEVVVVKSEAVSQGPPGTVNIEGLQAVKLEPDSEVGPVANVVCPGCQQQMAWSSYAEGDYDEGWHCNSASGCSFSEGNSGAFRYFCLRCEEDICKVCAAMMAESHSPVLASLRRGARNALFA